MNFIRSIGRNIYDPEYYQEVVKKSLGKTLKYFFAFMTLAAFLLSLVTTFHLVPILNGAISSLASGTMSAIPDSLVFSIKDGKTALNQPDALVIPFMIKTNKVELPKNIVVIDPSITTTPSPEQFLQKDTFVLVTSNILVGKNNDQINYTQLSTTTNLTLDKATIKKYIDKCASYTKFIPYALFILLFIIFYLILLIGSLVGMFIFALIIWAVAAVLKNNIGYGGAYKAGLHLLTLPILVKIALLSLGVATDLSLITFSVLVFAVLNFWPVKTDAQTSPTA